MILYHYPYSLLDLILSIDLINLKTAAIADYSKDSLVDLRDVKIDSGKSVPEKMNEYFEQEEDVLSYALFPNIALDFFKLRRAEKYGIESEFTDFENKVTIV